MALPSTMKLSHAIFDHPDRECSKDVSLHFHKSEFDCEFQQFKLSYQFYTGLQEISYPPRPQAGITYGNLYTFLNTYQRLHFSLRGPPVVA